MQLENVFPNRPARGRQGTRPREAGQAPSAHPPRGERPSTSGHTFPKNGYIDARVHMDTCCVLSTALEWRSESSLWEPALPSYHMGSGTELRLSGLAASAFIDSAISVACLCHETSCLVLLTTVFQVPSSRSRQIPPVHFTGGMVSLESGNSVYTGFTGPQ